MFASMAKTLSDVPLRVSSYLSAFVNYGRKFFTMIGPQESMKERRISHVNPICAQCCKTFYVPNLRVFVIR
jgi:hypothetical protein